MEIGKLTIGQIQALLKEEAGEELLVACMKDSRGGVVALAKRYERQRERALKEQQRLLEMYRYEDEAIEQGREIIAGVDEAGRGPLAGPVSVAAVILPHRLLLPKLNDSKKLSAKVRDELYDEIMAKAIAVRQIFIEPEEIDRINILQGVMRGMYQVLEDLEPKPQQVLIDAVKLDKLSIPQLSLIKGDAKSASIAAASIIAKVSRDRLMEEYHKKYPEYGFSGHKGYGTAEHIEAIKKYGPCPIHRLSFEPIRSLVGDK